jgi:cytidylate kinase
MIVTIDGPAGAGKSSAARRLAQSLGFEFLDTGAMYRAVTLAALRFAVAAGDAAALEALLDTLHLEMTRDHVFLNKEDVSALIRTPEVTARAGAIADSPVVRRRLVAWQRALARGKSIVCEGRDQGTIVFPDAGCKFFLVADPRERAARRHRELEARGATVSVAEVLQAQRARDEGDAARAIAPMVPAEDAILLDTTGLTLAQVVERMEEVVRRRVEAEESAGSPG